MPEHLTAGLFACQLIEQFERHPFVAFHCGGVSGPCTGEVLEIKAGDGFEVRNDDAEDSAGAENTATLSEKSRRCAAWDMFKDMGMIDRIKRSGSEWQWLLEVQPHDSGRIGRNKIRIHPIRVEACPAAEIEVAEPRGGHCICGL